MRTQFGDCALGLVNGRPMQWGQKNGADKGVDGRLYMTDREGDAKTIIVSVKGGHVTAARARDLRDIRGFKRAPKARELKIEPVEVF